MLWAGITRIPVLVAGSRASILTLRYQSYITQQSFEQLNDRCVAVVIDPIQSVRGKVVIDAFRLINPMNTISGTEPRQSTSNTGFLNKPSLEAMYKGLNKYYYSININYRTNELEQKMLLNLYKQKWNNPLRLSDPKLASEETCQNVADMANLAQEYAKRIE
jgi:26S proteasome regulatory subunit N11